MRTASVDRKTKETDVSVTVALDGTGAYDVATGIGFFDHMLEQLSRHSLIDMKIRASGDLHIDQHHTVEDVGITLGLALKLRFQVRHQQRAVAVGLEPRGGGVRGLARDGGVRPSLRAAHERGDGAEIGRAHV